MMSLQIVAVLMAAGGGRRMKSKLPKTLHLLDGKPMVSHVVTTLVQLKEMLTKSPDGSASLEKLLAVVGVKSSKVSRTIKEAVSTAIKEDMPVLGVDFVKQKKQLGTGDAVKQALFSLQKTNESNTIADTKLDGKTLLVLPADVPNISPTTLEKLIAHHLESANSATLLTAELKNPTGYGRILHNENSRVLKIVEQKDATPDELEIKEVCTSIYCFNAEKLERAIQEVNSENASQEYYLTDVVKILIQSGNPVGTLKVDNHTEILGVNTPAEFEMVENLRKKI